MIGAPAIQRPLGRMFWWLMTAAFLGLALYGSLVPFQYTPRTWEQASARWDQLSPRMIGFGARADFVANILLFIPLGYLLMAAICVDRPQWVEVPAVLAVVMTCIALAVGIEFTQIWFPPRTVSMNDVIAESWGGVLGVLAWLVAGRRVTDWLRAFWLGLRRQGLAVQLMPFYLVLLLLVHVMPLDLTISPVELYHKYKAGRINLIPGAGWSAAGWSAACNKLLWQVVYYAPFGLLLANMSSWRPRRLGVILAAGLGLAAAMEFLQLFVATRHSDTTDIVTGGVAVLGGFVLARALQRGGAGTRSPATGWAAAALLGWVAVLVVIDLQPFDFETDPAYVRHRLDALPLIPFADMYQGTEYNAFDQIFHKTLLYLPVGGLVALLRGGAGGGATALLVGFAVAAFTEVGQLLLPTRIASVSDVLVKTAAAVLGFVLARWLVTQARTDALLRGERA